MVENQPAPQNTSSYDWMTIAQLALSGLGMVFSLLAAGLLVILAVISLTGDKVKTTNVTNVLGLAWISLLVAILCAPSILFSIRRMMGRPDLSIQRRFHLNAFRIATALLVTWPLVLFLGYLISGKSSLDWLLLPPLQLLAVGIPVWWLVEFARRKLETGGEKRSWGLMNFSILITTPALMFVEIFVFLILVIIFAIWVTSQPEMLAQLQNLASRLSRSGNDPEEVLRLMAPYLQNPLLIFGIGALIAGIVPLIEELLKPLAVWLLVGRNITPAQGFAAGAVSGGAFALVESLFYISSPLGEGWWQLAAGRAGTELLHITTTALVGWALALAWRNGSYVRLGLSYLLAVTLHGLWNGLSILNGIGNTLKTSSIDSPFLIGLAQVTPFAIAILVVTLFTLLWNANRVLRAETRASSQEAVDTISLPPTDSSQLL